MEVYIYEINNLPENIKEIIKDKEKYIEIKNISTENEILKLKRKIIVIPKNKKLKKEIIKSATIENEVFLIFENPTNELEEILTHFSLKELKRRIKSIKKITENKQYKIVKLYASIIFDKPVKYLTDEELKEAEKQLIEKFNKIRGDTQWEKIKKFEHEINQLFLMKRSEKISSSGIHYFLKKHNLV